LDGHAPSELGFHFAFMGKDTSPVLLRQPLVEAFAAQLDYQVRERSVRDIGRGVDKKPLDTIQRLGIGVFKGLFDVLIISPEGEFIVGAFCIRLHDSYLTA
jgi:hypothetical protein